MSVIDMQDRELLELAARAAGYRFEWVPDHRDSVRMHAWINHACWLEWNPLQSRADAMELASKLGLIVDFFHERAMLGILHTSGSREWHYPEDGGQTYPAICRAIVRAAAEIGKQMPC